MPNWDPRFTLIQYYNRKKPRPDEPRNCSTMGNSQSEFDEKVARQLSLHDGSANLKTFIAAADFSPQNLETPSETATVQNSDTKSGQEEGKTGITPDSQTKLDSETKGDDKNIKNSPCHHPF